jgi:hypothetical protein
MGTTAFLKRREKGPTPGGDTVIDSSNRRNLPTQVFTTRLVEKFLSNLIF